LSNRLLHDKLSPAQFHDRKHFPLLQVSPDDLTEAIPWEGGSPVRTYEIAYIADPDLDDDSLSALEERIQGWIENADGKILNTDRWGKRRLAYPLQKKTEGVYFFLTAELPPNGGALIEQNMNVSEQVMRYMITLHAEV
jgi:small subunit ribosomal protein S6